MKKLETIIYIVGPKRSWEFQARHVKRIFLFILLVILGLGGTIGYQEYDHLQALKKADEKLDQENLKNEKLLALIARIREEGMKDNPSVTTTDVDLSKQQKLNEQQSILIEQQRKELGDLKGVLTQRERVIQQFQLEKQSTKDQVIDLQEKLRVSQENFEQASLETQTTQQQVQDIQKELETAQKSLVELKKKNSVKPKIVESSANSKSVISVSNLKIARSASNKINISLIIKQSKVPVIVDAGIGTASDATIAMEMGCDGVLINSAIANSKNPIKMARAFKNAVIAGRESYLAGRMKKNYFASPSSPIDGLI